MKIAVSLTEVDLVELERAAETRCRWYETRGYDVPAAAADAWRKIADALEDLRKLNPNGHYVD